MNDLNSQHMSKFLTTEHSTLQRAKDGILLESKSRMESYLRTLAGGMIALAFVAQASEIGPVFFAVSFVIFSILIFLGSTTFIRLMELSVSEVFLVQAINRIRHAYLEMAPESGKYFSFPAYDDPEAIEALMLPFTPRFHPLASMGGQVGLLNSFSVGVFASVLVAGLFSLSLLPASLIGMVIMIVVIGLHVRSGARMEPVVQQRMEIRFPTPES